MTEPQVVVAVGVHDDGAVWGAPRGREGPPPPAHQSTSNRGGTILLLKTGLETTGFNHRVYIDKMTVIRPTTVVQLSRRSNVGNRAPTQRPTLPRAASKPV